MYIFTLYFKFLTFFKLVLFCFIILYRFSCDHCSLTFSLKWNLKRHCQRKHGIDPLKKRFCPISHSSFSPRENHRKPFKKRHTRVDVPAAVTTVSIKEKFVTNNPSTESHIPSTHTTATTTKEQLSTKQSKLVGRYVRLS